MLVRAFCHLPRVVRSRPILVLKALQRHFKVTEKFNLRFPATTHLYVEADLKMKEAALKAVQPLVTKQARYQAPDRMLRFLQGL